MTDGHPPAGWFPDPLGRYDHRWFNGRTWTADVSVDGNRFVDPLGVDLGPPSRTDRSTTAALVCGIVGVTIAWVPLAVVLGTVLGVIAVAAGYRGRRSARSTGSPSARATTGMGFGVATLLVSIVGWTLTVDLFREVVAFVEPGPRLVDQVACSIVDDVDGTTAVVTGTLTNLDDDIRSYTVFVTVGADEEAPGTVARYAEIVDLPAGEMASWTVRVDGVGAGQAQTTCAAQVVVNGPFPWGIATDPYVE